MTELSTQCASQRQRVQRESERLGDRVRWTVGVVVATAAIGALLLALACAPASIRANNTLCLQQIANDEHVSLEAFFQNPAEQDAFVEAMTICSR